MHTVGLQFEGFNIIRIFPYAFHNVENGQKGTNDRGIFFINFFFKQLQLVSVWVFYFLFMFCGLVE